MGALAKGDKMITGPMIIDTALSNTSENAVQNKVIKTEFDAINTKLGNNGISLLKIITTTGEQSVNINDYAFIIIQLLAYGIQYPVGTQIIFDNCTEVGLGKDNGYTSSYGALVGVSFTNNIVDVKTLTGIQAQVRIYGVFPK